METGDIIYFLIAIIVFIGSLFEKKAKKRKQGIPPSPPSPPNVFKKTEHQKAASSVSKVKQIAQKARTKTYSTLDMPSSLDSVFTCEGDSDIPDELYTIAELEAMEAVKKTMRHPFVDALKKENLQQEMQKGIIYSEILHRKY